MHDLIVANSSKASENDLLAYSKQIGLDLKRFQSDLQNHKYKSTIEHDLLEASQRGVLGTPVFFLNSTRIEGLQPEKTIDDLIAGQFAGHLQ
jgi:predicted DsbA family dithiol-disulfide isomerase